MDDLEQGDDAAGTAAAATTRGPLLLSQLDLILASDPLIDELGFVHPAQLTSLHEANETAAKSTCARLEGSNSADSASSLSTSPSAAGVDDVHSRSTFSQEAPNPGTADGRDVGGRPSKFPDPLDLQNDPAAAATELLRLQLDGDDSFMPTMSSSSTEAEDWCPRSGSLSKADGGAERSDVEAACVRMENENGEGGGLSLPYDASVFWCGDHKLAISMLALAPMYVCAQSAFMSIRASYKKLLQADRGLGLDGLAKAACAGEGGDEKEENKEDAEGGKLTRAAMKSKLEDSLLSYSRALVLINCDHASAWNTRKQIIHSRAANQRFLNGELHMASVVLSRGHKSEETWAHRRWVIEQIVSEGTSQAELDSLLESESKLVEGIAGRSLMNYRAWRHRCWLVSQMSSLQVAVELNRTKVWAASHVADNCGFHYRRCLLLQLIKSVVPEKNQAPSSGSTNAAQKQGDMKSLRVIILDVHEAKGLWKEEMDWIKKLIQQFWGREALWIHLRFLRSTWVHHLGPCRPSLSAVCKRVLKDAQESVHSLKFENEFAESCLSACKDDLTEAGHRQREFAATYKLWVTMLEVTDGVWSLSLQEEHEKVSTEHEDNRKIGYDLEDSDDLVKLEQLLQDAAPHRKQLWDALLPKLQKLLI